MRFRRSLLALGVSIFIFSICLPQRADALIYQLNNTTGEFFPNINNSVPGIQYATTAAADPNATHEQVYSVILRVYNDKSTNGCVVGAGVTNGTIANGTTSGSQLTMDGQTWYDHEFVFNTSTGVIYADEITKLYFSRNSGCLTSQFSPKVATGPVGSYPYATTCHNASGTCTVSSTESMFFILRTVTDTNTTNPPNLDYNANFNEPICGDFQNWEIENTLTSSTRNNAEPRSVCVSVDSNPAEVGTSYSYWECAPANPGGLSTLVSKDVPLNFNQYYYTQAYLCEGDVHSDLDTNLYPATDDFAPCDTIIVDSPLYSLLVTDAGQCLNNTNLTPSNTTTPENGSIIDACNSVSSFLGKGFCYLFIPSQQSFLQFITIKDQFATKVPMGYFTIYEQSISDLSSATSTTSSVQTVDSSFASDLDEWATLDIIQTIRGILTWLFWLVFIFYMYHRFKNFSLHG